MALRRATSHALRLALRPRGGVRFGSSGGYPGMPLPRASDVAVSVNLKFHGGEVARITGRVGQSIVDACAAHGIEELYADDGGGGAITDIVHRDSWTEQTFGEGPQSVVSHVILTNDWVDKVPPPLTGEETILKHSLDEGERRGANSRLASEITLTKELDGITCFVPPQPPFNIP